MVRWSAVELSTAPRTPPSNLLLLMVMRVPVGLRLGRQGRSLRLNTPQLQAAKLQAAVLFFS
jgi:hypothetical protein